LVTGEGRGREYQREAMLRVRNTGDHTIDHRVSPRDKRLLVQAKAWVVEDSHAMIPVRRDNVDGVH
jgi:hypothetical protein